ncbi:MAG TPA: hypothetical protein VFK85_11450 [Anaeromyxobacteraceae bacterium]|nr:hypothetical protein [Anaeromyxobacteraceae bacterium]
MRNVLGSLVAVAVLAFAGAAQAQDSYSYPGVHTHDGFFLQMDLGVGGMASSVDQGGGDLKLSGGSGQFSVGVGGAVARNFVIAGQVWAVSVPDPDVKLGGTKLGEADATLSLSGIGVQLVYYFMPLNVYVSATPSLTRLSLDEGSSTGESDTGFGMKLAVGKEWWVSDNWALGLNGQFAFSTNDDSGVAGAPSWGTGWFGVAFSATFN